VGEYGKNMQKKIYRQISTSSHQCIGGGDNSLALRKLVRGFTIIELLVVMAIIAGLIAIAIPAISAMQKSYNSTLATARTLAISRGQYAGVRFQKKWKSTDDLLKAQQYMIFIINDEDMGTLTDAYRDIEGYKPIKLPENTGVMDMKLGTNNDADIILDVQVNEANELVDTTAFSIIFSPAGKLVIHDVQIRNKNGKTDDTSKDDVFNTKKNVDDGNSMFLQDDYDSPPNDWGLGKEQSRSKFVMYDCEKFKKLDVNKRFSNYLKNLKPVYVNPYTGEIIK
jgi:prepilin-type N-terminal cleavage/methylation domain-containing protein